MRSSKQHYALRIALCYLLEPPPLQSLLCRCWLWPPICWMQARPKLQTARSYKLERGWPAQPARVCPLHCPLEPVRAVGYPLDTPSQGALVALRPILLLRRIFQSCWLGPAPALARPSGPSSKLTLDASSRPSGPRWARHIRTRSQKQN